MAKPLKLKVHAVVVEGQTTLVMAATKQGAISAVIDERVARMRHGATADLATGEQLYLAGLTGTKVLHGEQFGPTTPAEPDLLSSVGGAGEETKFCPVAAENAPAVDEPFAAGTSFDPNDPINSGLMEPHPRAAIGS